MFHQNGSVQLRKLRTTETNSARSALSALRVPRAAVGSIWACSLRGKPSIGAKLLLIVQHLGTSNSLELVEYVLRIFLRFCSPRHRADWLRERQTTPGVFRLATTRFPHSHATPSFDSIGRGHLS